MSLLRWIFGPKILLYKCIYKIPVAYVHNLCRKSVCYDSNQAIYKPNNVRHFFKEPSMCLHCWLASVVDLGERVSYIGSPEDRNVWCSSCCPRGIMAPPLLHYFHFAPNLCIIRYAQLRIYRDRN
jgi:hypothetical protein